MDKGVPDIPRPVPHLYDVRRGFVRFVEEQKIHLGSVLREKREIDPLFPQGGTARVEPALRQEAIRFVLEI
jgi:hypothetical protein